MDTVKDKYIWILGASSGIGQALAEELDLQGAKLILSARREEKLTELKEKLSGSDHIVAPLDVSKVSDIQNAQNDILSKIGRIDSVIFMAAIYTPHDGTKRPLSFIRNALDVNVMGAFNLIDTIQPQFETQGHGQLVLCASVAGYRGLPLGQPYCATKAALINLSESLKVDLGLLNIDVKVISPGFVKTPLTDKNDFPMPMIIEAKDAAIAIRKGLCSNAFEIHFPKRFTFIMKFLRIIPNFLYFALAKKMNKEAQNG